MVRQTDNRFDKIYGALVGVAYGDAFGMPSEMMTKQEVKDYFGYIDMFLPGRPESDISRGLAAGEFTDDTVNTIFVVEMLQENEKKADAGIFIKKLRRWSDTSEKSIAVTGPSTAKAFAQLDAGVPMEETGKNGITNGAAMRIIPIGLVNSHQGLEELAEQVWKLSMPTHNSSAAISGATAIAAAAAYAVSGGESIAEMLQIACAAAESGASKGYQVCAPSVAKRILLGKQLVDESTDEAQALDAIYDIIGTGLPIVESVPAALALVYLAKGNPLICARYCANIGGDTDTIGAMACGICGGFTGINGFEKKEIGMLEKVNDISFERLAHMLL